MHFPHSAFYRSAWFVTSLRICGNMRNDSGHVVWRSDQSASFRIFDSAFYFPHSAIPHFTHNLYSHYNFHGATAMTLGKQKWMHIAASDSYVLLFSYENETKKLSASGGFAPPYPHQRLCTWTPLGAAPIISLPWSEPPSPGKSLDPPLITSGPAAEPYSQWRRQKNFTAGAQPVHYNF